LLKSLCDKTGNRDTLRIIRSAAQGMPDGMEYLAVTRLLRDRHEPIHNGRKADFLSHPIALAFAEQRPDYKMAREYALNIQPRILNPRDEVISQPRGVVTHPAMGQSFCFGR
jgi:hypothetical protein